MYTNDVFYKYTFTLNYNSVLINLKCACRISASLEIANYFTIDKLFIHKSQLQIKVETRSYIDRHFKNVVLSTKLL